MAFKDPDNTFCTIDHLAQFGDDPFSLKKFNNR